MHDSARKTNMIKGIIHLMKEAKNLSEEMIENLNQLEREVKDIDVIVDQYYISTKKEGLSSPSLS